MPLLKEGGEEYLPLGEIGHGKPFDWTQVRSQGPSSSKCSDMFLSIFNIPILRGGEIYFALGENGHGKGERASL